MREKPLPYEASIDHALKRNPNFFTQMGDAMVSSVGGNHLSDAEKKALIIKMLDDGIKYYEDKYGWGKDRGA